jgi:hypothetical protein
MRRIYTMFIVGLLVLLASLAATAQAVTSKNASRWQPGIFYSASKVVSFKNVRYKCLYSHTALPEWEPSKTSALWQRIGLAKTLRHESRGTAAQTKKLFAPYIHMSETDNNLFAIQAASGIKFFTIAFIVSDGGCTAAWQGKPNLPLATEKLFSQNIDAVRKAGGDVIVAFGGYAGKELSLACPDAVTLTAAYQSVLDKYKVTSLDFDIESSAADDRVSIERRSEALSRLVRANPGLQISFTVPVVQDGMPQTALDLLASAQKHNVPVSVVNLMTMDYGDPVANRNMGPLAIVSVDAALRQMRTIGLVAGVGITPMIGMNDTPGETFTLADASTVLSYARSNGAVCRLSMWSVGRDRGGCAGAVLPTCSGINQDDWGFTHIFQTF